jgi:serine/threonine protein phosphatase PrpC
MGCSSSSSDKKVPQQRRRLSVGQVDETATGGDQKESEEDRGLITALAGSTVIDMLDTGDGRKFSIGSQTDQMKQSFANKSIAEIGEKIDTEGLGYTCRKGLKPESPNQDSWMVLTVDHEFSIYGVFDGHGKQGHDVSQYVKEMLPKLIIRDQRFKTDDMGASLKDNFKKVQSLVTTADRMKKLSAQMSGTTATVAIHDHKNSKLTVSHVADSTCVLGCNKNGKYTGQKLTTDHKPNLPEERKRIEKAGGRVVFDGYANHRVYAKNGRYPGLNMSRCLGDLMGHADAGCSCEPEVSTRTLVKEDEILLVCSDGVWEFISEQEAVDMVANHKKAGVAAMQAAEHLAKEAWDRWIQEEGGAVVDDITVVLVYLDVFGKGGSSKAC